MTGPFETQRQAVEVPAVRRIYDVKSTLTGTIAPDDRQAIDDACSALILEACEQAGVELGAYDRRIIAWLGRWEPETCAVVAGLITRAAAGRSVPGPDARQSAADEARWRVGTNPELGWRDEATGLISGPLPE